MLKQKSLEITNAALLSSPYKYFVNIKRGNGTFGFRKEYKLSFPQLCSHCGLSIVGGYVEIGKPVLSLFSNVGKVPYCNQHYKEVTAKIRRDRTVVLPSLTVTGAIAILGLVAGLSMGLIELLVYLVSLPTALILEIIANRKYREDLAIADIPEDSKIQYPFDIISVVYACIFVFVVLYGFITLQFDVMCFLGIYAFLAFAIRQTILRSFVREGWYNRGLGKDGAVQVVNIVDESLYTLGFTNQEVLRKFYDLNRELITDVFDKEKIKTMSKP